MKEWLTGKVSITTPPFKKGAAVSAVLVICLAITYILLSAAPAFGSTGNAAAGYADCMLPLCAAVILLSAASVFCYIRIGSGGKSPSAAEVSYPPSGISSAEAGYLADGEPQDRDMMSLIIWFAVQGCLTFTGNARNLTINRLRIPDPALPEYMRDLFGSLFGKKNSVQLKKLPDDFYRHMQNGKSALGESFKGSRAIYKKKTAAAGFFTFALLILTPLSAFLSLEGKAAIILSIVLPVPLIGGICSAHAAAKSRLFARKSAGYSAGIMGFGLMALAMAIAGMVFAPEMPMLVFAAILSGFIGCAMTQLLYCQTEYGAGLTASVRGFRDFLEKAEPSCVRELAEEDTGYFFRTLPYAYAFGLADKWARKFENIPLSPPDWYLGADRGDFSALLLTRGLSSNLAAALAGLRSPDTDGP